MIRAEFAGAAAPGEIVEKTVLHFADGRYGVWFGAAESDAGSFAESGEGATRTLTLQADTGPNSGRTVRCIFQLVGDRLRICYGLDGKLPAHFRTHVDEPRYLATYRRLPPS